MGKPITNIVIVGGGTAGWIAAAYLNHRLQWGLTARPGVTVTVVESPNISTIGVGEATVPSLKGTLRILEISEAEFIQRTNATLKLGIRFDGWQVDGNGNPANYVHPFTGGANVRGRNPGYAFQQYGLPGENAQGSDFVRTISHTREAIEQFKGPRALDAAPFGGSLQYAYHIDAALLAQFFKEICLARGVKHIADDVTDVSLDERGFISTLHLKELGELPVELVIDCTGFRGMLINQVFGEPFLPFSDYLLNDRAIPIQVRRENPRAIVPATISTAMEAGWCWRISLHSRDGTGYVYSSAFKSDDEARAELHSFLGDQEHLASPGVLKMRVGRCQRSWVKNCVAIGLSSGFLEPLESTAILSVELAARWLLQHFPSMDFEEPLSRQFNAAVERFYDEVRDFLGLHFSLNNRSDTPYWKAVRHEAKLSDTLRANLELWKHSMPSIVDPRTDTVFSHWSVQCVLFGKGFYDGSALAGTEVVPEDVWRWFWAETRATKRGTLEGLPDHFDLLEAIRARAIAGESSARKPRGHDFSVDDDVLTAATRVMSPLRSSGAARWRKSVYTPPLLPDRPSPFVVGSWHTDLHGEAAEFAAIFRRHRAIAFSNVIAPPFLVQLLQICNRAQFQTDTATDKAHRQRERPGIAGSAIGLAFKRSNLLQWLEDATHCGTLRSAYGRVLQMGPVGVERLSWHDDLDDDPLRRLAVTINLSENAYEGGLFELRVKKSGELLAQYQHATPGSILVFQVSDDLEHRVWPLTSGGPRRVFTGWFVEHESSWL